MSEYENPSKYWSADNSIYLEDDSGRLILDISSCQFDFVTGIVMAILGIETADQKFKVLDYCLPGLAPQKSLSLAPSAPKYTLFVSDINLNYVEGSANVLKFDLLKDFILGTLAHSEEESKLVKQISHFVIAGNSVSRSMKKETGGKRYGNVSFSYDLSSLNSFDSILSNICQSIHVTLLPGDKDPTNIQLPQKRILPSLLPQSSCYSSLHCTTNPTVFELDGIRYAKD